LVRRRRCRANCPRIFWLPGSIWKMKVVPGIHAIARPSMAASMSMHADHSPSGKSEAPDHAALMDKVYRRQRYFYDFTRKYYLFGRDRAIHELRLPAGARLVEVGCGTARNLVRIARRYPN